MGHTGTLDPDVTGVLPVCLGKATKLVGQLTDTDKIYRCRMRFGLKTDTQDLSGQVLQQMEEGKVRDLLGGTGEEALRRVTEAAAAFTGEIWQIPPMYSALKVDGMKLVNAARRGVTVERKARKVTVHSISQIRVSEDLLHAEFTVHCSKGTYVRTLCEDLGEWLGIPACMEELERTQAAGLDLDSAITLQQAEQYAREGTLEDHLIPTDRFLTEHPSLTVRDEAVRKLIYGNVLEKQEFEDPPYLEQDRIYRVYDWAGEFYALYRYERRGNCLKCVKMFMDAESWKQERKESEDEDHSGF